MNYSSSPSLDSPPHSTLTAPEQTSQNTYVISPASANYPYPPDVNDDDDDNNNNKKVDGEEVVGDVEGGRKGLRPNFAANLRRSEKGGENIKRKALLGFRTSGFVFCLIAFSVMAADKNQGWALDSFHRYKEFRYCMTVNVLGFVYSGLQAYDLAHSLSTGNRLAGHQIRYCLDFSLDQVLTYLLLSASSSAVFRVENWESNWGKDKFPTMAKASVALSFLAFVAFALSSLISGYALFTPKST